MEEVAAAQFQAVIQGGDDCFEAFGVERQRIQQVQSKLAQHITCGVTGKHSVTFHAGENFFGVIVKDEAEKIGEIAAMAYLGAEYGGGVLAPSGLRR